MNVQAASAFSGSCLHGFAALRDVLLGAEECITTKIGNFDRDGPEMLASAQGGVSGAPSPLFQDQHTELTGRLFLCRTEQEPNSSHSADWVLLALP